MHRFPVFLALLAWSAALPALADTGVPLPALNPTPTETLPVAGAAPGQPGPAAGAKGPVLSTSQRQAMEHHVPAPLTYTPQVQAPAPAAAATPGPGPRGESVRPLTFTAKSGAFLVGVGFSQYLVGNGAPLSYNFDLGYQFANDLVLRTGIDSFFYEGRQGDTLYSYSYNNFVTTLCRLFGRGPLRPYAGVSLDVFTGQAAQANVTSAPQVSAPGGFGGGILAGGRWRFQPSLELQAQVHLMYAFSALGFVPSFGLGLNWVL